MNSRLTRRSVVRGALAVPFITRVLPARADTTSATFSLPIALPGQVPGDGFLVRHGYACENTWYNPGRLHTAEDWYLADGSETGGVAVLAIVAGRAATKRTSAEHYRLWYELALSDGERGWVQAALPDSNDTGSDGRPFSVRFAFLPVVTARND